MTDATQAAALPRLDSVGQSILFRDARTPKSFLPRPVTVRELREIWDLARWPPTSLNSQPLRVLFVQSPEARKRLVRHLWPANRERGAAAPVAAVLAWDTRFHDRYAETAPDRPELQRLFGGNQQLRVQTGEYNGALQAAYLLIAVRAVGLAVGPMAGFDADGMDKEFFPDGRLRSQLVVTIGHPDPRSWPERRPRLDPDDVLQWV